MARGVTFRRLHDTGDPTWHALIALYTKVFAEGQRETERAILRNLVTPDEPRTGGHLVIAAESRDGGCVGGVIFSYLPEIDCGYVSYIFVAPRLRNHGIGMGLLDEMRRSLASESSRARGRAVRGLFAEIERGDPRRGSRRQRFRFWDRARVVPLELDWRYPALHGGEPPVPMYLAYGPYGRRRDAWYPADLEAVAFAIFEATYSYLPSARATLSTIREGLRRLPPELPVPYICPWRPAAVRRD